MVGRKDNDFDHARAPLGLVVIGTLTGSSRPSAMIASYHDLWHVEQSFRMSRSDLRARPLFHHTREAIEAHLTIVFAALAVSRQIQNRTGLAIRNVLRQLRPLRSATIAINGTEQTFPPAIPADKQALLDALRQRGLRH